MAKPTVPTTIFRHRPSTDQMPQQLPLLRVPPKGLSGLVILSHDIVGCDTHYWRGRTRPCEAPNCDACQANQRPRWRGYLAVMSQRTEKIGVIELTPAAVAPVDRAFRQARTLRGCQIALARKNEKPNGQLFAQISVPNETKEHLPKAPNLKTYLAKLWDLNVIKPHEITTDEVIKMRDEDQRNQAS